jgi:hypothetical protein
MRLTPQVYAVGGLFSALAKRSLKSRPFVAELLGVDSDGHAVERNAFRAAREPSVDIN